MALPVAKRSMPSDFSYLVYQAAPQFRRFKGGNSSEASTDIIPLPIELLYQVLENLSLTDVISFTFCRWDFFLNSIGFLKEEIGPALRHLDALAALFNDNRWPKSWLLQILQHTLETSETILQDFDVFLAVFEETGEPANILRDVVRKCATCRLPTLHGCLSYKLYHMSSLYLQRNPSAVFQRACANMTVLHTATISGATYLLEVIAEILKDMPQSCRASYIDQVDEFGNTALTYALRAPTVQPIDILVRAGGDCNKRDALGFTLLMNACFHGSHQVVKYLVQCGADVTARNNFDHSALEQVMMGESSSKDELFHCLKPYLSQSQLNKALWNDWTNGKQRFKIKARRKLLRWYWLGLKTSVFFIDARETQYADDLGTYTAYDEIQSFGTVVTIRWIPEAYVPTVTLRNVSDWRNRVPQIMHLHSNGTRTRKYGRENILGIYGVLYTGKRSIDELRKTPTIYVKVKWTGIDDEDAGLCPGDYSWITRSELIRMIGQTLADMKIQEAWVEQVAQYARWKREGRH
ncbi:hypothetical protein N7488_008951 [Penicillium malachiteum]|nr:hypothetical protein N7488_008951 [Penicillium malachiteum]